MRKAIFVVASLVCPANARAEESRCFMRTLGAKNFHFALAAMMCVVCCSGSAIAFETYAVTGVAADDNLIIREEPSDEGKPSDWRKLGDIPANAKSIFGTGRSKLVGGQRWREIMFGSILGWVNAKYISEVPSEVPLSQETLSCLGTEPFWSLTLSPAGSEYERPDDPEIKTAKITVERTMPASGRRFPLLYRIADAEGRKYHATVSNKQWCTDDMSDYDYSFQVLLSSDNEFLEGCCVIKR